MIRSLIDFYDKKVQEKGCDIPKFGWMTKHPAVAIRIDENGNYLGLVSLEQKKTIECKGRSKTISEIPSFNMPYSDTVTSGIKPSFLCQGWKYLMGISSSFFTPLSGKENEDKKRESDIARAKKCFAASRDYHREILKNHSSIVAIALLRYFQTWEIDKAYELQEVKNNHEEYEQYQFVFMVNNTFAHKDPDIIAAWEQFFSLSSEERTGVSLISGQRGPIARLHGMIKGVRGAQTSGAAVVSFNNDAFLSYGKEQNYNAPMTTIEAFKYTTALNYLISHEMYKYSYGSLLVLFWTPVASDSYIEEYAFCLDGKAHGKLGENELSAITEDLVAGKPVDEEFCSIHENEDFCICGIVPNASRLSVRFFFRGSFGSLLHNVFEHYKRQELSDAKGIVGHIYPWEMLLETTRDGKTSNILDNISADYLRAIITNNQYPAQFINRIMIRIRADRIINASRVSAVKAYWIKSITTEQHLKEEVFVMKLNEDSTYTPYVLGRLFSVLEFVQRKAQDLNDSSTTIKDRFFNSASTTPSIVMPLVMRLSNAHLRVLKRKMPGLAIKESQIIASLLSKLNEPYPDRLNLKEQGAFILGYYHQNSSNYTKTNKE